MKPLLKNRLYLIAAGLLGLSFSIPIDASAHHGGTCYISKNKSHICYVKTSDSKYAAAITDGSSVKPTVLAFDCDAGWTGAGDLNKEIMFLIVAAICKENAATSEVLIGSNN